MDETIRTIREEYARLLGITRRSPEQEARYVELAETLLRVPCPLHTAEEHERYLLAVDRMDAWIAAMTPEQAARLNGMIARTSTDIGGSGE